MILTRFKRQNFEVLEKFTEIFRQSDKFQILLRYRFFSDFTLLFTRF